MNSPQENGSDDFTSRLPYLIMHNTEPMMLHLQSN